MNKFCNEANAFNEITHGSLDKQNLQSTKTIRVLSVGAVDQGNMIHDALLKGPGFHHLIATDYRELWAMRKQEDFQLAILHNTLVSFELRESSQFIRLQWPHARILVIRTGEDFLDDALYDDRVIPIVTKEVLLMTIEQLTAGWHERRSRDGRL